MKSAFYYDPDTDSLYITLRPDPATDTRIVSENLSVDLGADGKPVGYDIQHASETMQTLFPLEYRLAPA